MGGEGKNTETRIKLKWTRKVQRKLDDKAIGGKKFEVGKQALDKNEGGILVEGGKEGERVWNSETKVL